MTRTRITLSNDFHNTSTLVLPKLDGRERWILTKDQVNRASEALCGIEGCTCGDEAGTRGPQLQPSGCKATLLPFSAGGAEVTLSGGWA